MNAWAYIALAVTLAAQAIGTMVMYGPPVLAPDAQLDIGVSASSIGGFTSVSYIGAVLASLVSGLAIARYGPLRWTQVCLVFSACGIALIATANLFLVMVGALVIGAGYGPLTPASSAILVTRTPERLRATILSIKQTGVPGGGALAGAIIPVLIVSFGWKVAALALGGLCLLLALAIEPVRAEFDRGTGAHAASGTRQSLLESLRMTWRHRELRQVSIIAFMYSGMQMVFVAFFVVYLTQSVGLSLVSAGAALAVGMVAGVFGRVMWGVAADRLVEPRRLLGGVGLGTSAALFALALSGPGWPLAAIYAVGMALGLTSIAWNGVFLAEVARIAPHGNVGMATSAALIYSYGGVVVVPAVCGGILALSGSYSLMFGLMAALNAMVAVMPLRTRSISQ